MGENIGKLNALQVGRLAKGTARDLINDGGGLYLQVTPKGASWIFRYRLDPKHARDMGLGPYHTIGLAEAREKARECRKLRLEGKDPIEERRRERSLERLADVAVVTFQEAAERYIAAHRPGWRSATHAAQWSSTLEAYVYPIFGAVSVAAVDTGLVLKALEPIWATKPETASRVRGRIEAVLDWAKAAGYRREAGENAARWRGHLENLLPKRSKVRRVEHHAALPYPEIGDFMADLQRQEGVAARALEFTVMTVARSAEARGARWAEINLAERVWIVPAARMKAGREHRVPLSDAAMAIVEAMAAICQSEYVFPGGKAGRPLQPSAMASLLKERMGRAGATVHGMRSVFASWAAERTAYPHEVRELALAHQVGSAVERSYIRTDLFDRRRRLLEDWARFCLEPAAEGEVVAIGAR